MSFVKREPALATAIITAIVLVGGALLARFAGVDIDEGEWTAIILGALGLLGAGAATRPQVTPNLKADARAATAATTGVVPER